MLGYRKLVRVTAQSVLIALLSVSLDQVYHILTNSPHTIFDIAYVGTQYYIGFKFLVVSAVAWLVLSEVIPYYRSKILTLSLIATIIFSYVIYYLFPNEYGIFIHISHLIIIYFSSHFILRIIKSD